jgi:hypothetical protein
MYIPPQAQNEPNGCKGVKFGAVLLLYQIFQSANSLVFSYLHSNFFLGSLMNQQLRVMIVIGAKMLLCILVWPVNRAALKSTSLSDLLMCTRLSQWQDEYSYERMLVI